jgi:type II secretory pathway component PulJ
MLVVISITSLVLTSVAVALHSLFGVERHLRRDLATETVQARLDVLLRDDAHRASAVEAVTRDGETVGLIFMLPNEHRVEYRTEAGRILRVAQTGDKVLHRELFRLGDETFVEWTIEREQALAIACVTLSRTPGRIEAAKNASRTDRLEAVVGLDTTHSRTRPGG